MVQRVGARYVQREKKLHNRTRTVLAGKHDVYRIADDLDILSTTLLRCMGGGLKSYNIIIRILLLKSTSDRPRANLRPYMYTQRTS